MDALRDIDPAAGDPADAAPIVDQRDPGFVIPDTIVHPLRRPLVKGDRSFDTLTFRVPTFADLKRFALAEIALQERLDKRAQMTKSAPPLIENGLAGMKLATLSLDGLKEEDLGRLLSLDVDLASERLNVFLRLADGPDDELGDRQRDEAFAVPETVTHELRRPFARAAMAGETVRAVSFRPPTYEEAKRCAARRERDGAIVGLEFMMVLLGDDGLTAPELGRMLALDFQLAAEKLAPFLALMKRSAAT